MLNLTRGVLIEYSLTVPPLALVFEFNPETLTRNRSVQLKAGSAPGTRGGYDFKLPTETRRAAQGVTVEAESFSLKILLDATDRMNEGDAVATDHGIEPELATLRSMVEPKSHGPAGSQLLASLGMGGRASDRHESASVILFFWGTHILPVFLTSIEVEEKAHLPSLVPYRAEVTLRMQVIESNNPFFRAEAARQMAMAARNTAQTVAGSIARAFGGTG